MKYQSSLNTPPGHVIITLLVHDFSFSLFKSKIPDTLGSSRFANQCGATLMRGIRWAVLDKFDVICWEHSEMAIRTVSSPPAFVNHLNAGDDLIRVKRDLCVISWKQTYNAARLRSDYKVDFWLLHFSHLKYFSFDTNVKCKRTAFQSTLHLTAYANIFTPHLCAHLNYSCECL